MKNQNTNLFMAVIIVIGFVFFWDAFVVSKYAPPKKPAAPSAPVSAPQLTEAAPKSPAVGDRMRTPGASTHGDKLVVMRTLENSENRVTFESQGARVLSWELKEKDHWIQLVPPAQSNHRLPLETFPDVNFAVDYADGKKVVFSGVLPGGVKVTKTFALNSGLPNELTLAFNNPNNMPQGIAGNLEWGGGLFKQMEGAKEEAKLRDQTKAEIRAVAFAEKAKAWKPGAFFGKTKDENMTGPFKWAGVDNEHFLAAFIPENGPLSDIRVHFDKAIPPSISIPLADTIAPNTVKTIGYKLYVGPKKLDDLERIGYDLKFAVDYGFLEKILLFSLLFFNKFTHNFGWAIILLTVCVQILMFPLTKKSLQSSLKMKAVQPQIKKIQEMYRKDPQRLHVETMNIYKKHGMKFMGMEGCLPLVLQMPIFFAIFKMLRSAYDLRGAEWIFWVKDLSAADPYYVLPVLMGVGMFLQQKMTTVSVDPQQAKMMYIFPVVLTFMFSSMPAGLVIYWIVQSLATVVIQKILMLHISSEAPAKS